MPRFDETCRTATGPRILGLGTFIGCSVLAAWLLLSGGAPVWTWVVLGLFLLISGLAALHDFGDLWHVTDEGLSYRNTITEKLGFARARSVSWERVLRASEYEGRTWFLTVEDDKRWVLDRLAEHDRLGLIFQELDIPVAQIERPRPWRRGSGGEDLPRG